MSGIQAEATGDATSPPGGTTVREAHFALGSLLMVAIFSHLDRKLLSILQEPIKAELGLSDVQLGALTGLAFSVVYTVVALPMSRVTDRVSRKWVIISALVVWSLMTAASGVAAGFLTLLICRMGVAIGESACTPATMSLLSDFFSSKKRAFAIAICSMGVPIGTMLGSATGGWLTSELGWRSAFIHVGLAGLVLVPLLLLIKEPPRGQFDAAKAKREIPPPLEAFLSVWRIPSFRLVILGAAAQTFVLTTVMAWGAPFYGRVHHMPIEQIGLALAVIFGLGGGLGTFFGGLIAGRLTAKDARGYAIVPAFAAAASLPLGLAQFLSAGTPASLAFGFLNVLMLSAFIGPAQACVQTLARPDMRAFSSAVMLIFTSLIGAGLGPFITGALSDGLKAAGFGDGSLRYAVCITLTMTIVACILFVRASNHLSNDINNNE